MAVLEHRVKTMKEAKIIAKIVRGWSWISNATSTSKGRIWVFWDPNIFDFNVIDISAQCIHGMVRIYATNLLFNFTIVYGYHTIQDRRG